jgi:putative ABC transport system permease protein
MSLFRIALRSILQRGVASLLTTFSMALGVMLVVAVLSIHGVISQSFRNNASLGYNMIVGAKGGQEQLTLNTVFYLSKPVENIPYTYYLEFLKRGERDRLQQYSFAVECKAALDDANAALAGDGVLAAIEQRSNERIGLNLVPDTRAKSHFPRVEIGRDGKYGLMTDLAIPLCLGDFFGRFRVVGTTPVLFDDFVWDIDNNRKFEFAQGRNFRWHDAEHGYFEAVVGSTVARELDVKLGQGISPRHGDPEGHAHEQKFTVVGILAPSGTPNDRAVFVNMEGFYLMADHANPLDEPKSQAMEAKPIDKETWEALKKSRAEEKQKTEAKMAIQEPLPVEQREVTAVLLKVPYQLAPGLENGINEGTQAQAVLPVAVIYGLFEFIVNPIEWTLLVLTAMICVVSGISILVSIYNSMSERRGEIAVMRALGAGRGTVMTIILLEATLLALAGGFLGWFVGHLACWLAGPAIEQRTGVLVGFLSLLTLPLELAIIPSLIVLAILVGIWPAISAYRTDVAKSLGK